MRWTFIICSSLLCACGNNDPDPRVADLEQRLAACEADRATLQAASTPPEAEEPSEPVAPDPPEEEHAEEEDTGGWESRESPDELTGRPIRTLIARSRNDFELDFPYQGRQRAELTLRQHPRFGNDVLLIMQRGQFICDVLSCRAEVVFDDHAPVRWRANRSESGSSNIMFLTQADRFRREAERAHEIRIGATVYGRGQMVFVFPGLLDSPPSPPTEGEAD